MCSLGRMTALAMRRVLTSIGRVFSAGIVMAVAAAGHAQLPGNARLRFVVEARQLGPVGYRDPVGVMSPDGQWIAYASEGRVRLTQVAGGPVSTVSPFGRVASIAWHPDSRHVAALQIDTLGNSSWSLIDVPGGDR